MDAAHVCISYELQGGVDDSSPPSCVVFLTRLFALSLQTTSECYTSSVSSVIIALHADGEENMPHAATSCSVDS